MKLKYLKRKSVVNIYNGNFIGSIVDIIISMPSGNIDSLIVRPNFFKRIMYSLSRSSKFIISWNNIVSIGKDVILVNIIDN